MLKLRRFALGTGIVLWVALPVIALVLLMMRAESLTIRGPQAQVWVTPEPSPTTLSTPVDVALVLQEESPIRAPAWSGLIQSVDVAPSSLISDGSPVATIDGILRIAIVTPRPFHRALALGDKGADVSMLNEVLARRGNSHGAGDKFDLATRAGVRELAQSMGAGKVDIFDPTWFIFLQSNGLEVASIALSVGERAPSAGTAIANITPRVVNAKLVQYRSLDSLLTQNSGEVVRLSEEAIQSNLLVLDPSDSVYLGDAELTFTEDRSSLSAESTALVAESAGIRTVIKAFIRTPAPSGSWVVPTSALFVSPQGRVCVLEQKGDRAAPREVELISDAHGRSTVQAALELHSRVLVNPAAELRTC